MKSIVSAVMASLVLAGAAQAASGASRLVTKTAVVPPDQKGRVVARCPAGMHATGGGFQTTHVAANDSFPLVVGGRAVGWVLTTHKPKAPTGGTATAGKATVYALCQS